MKKLIFWEMNEINFEFIDFYIKQGLLGNWKKFIDQHGCITTTSEIDYENLEPWIQWPTVRSGLDYAEHKVFRLGDIVGSGVHQHWEILEKKGYKVAAISPINAENKTDRSPFWIPDPWVETKVSGNAFVRRVAKAVKQSVNDNANKKITFASATAIIEALIRCAKFSSLSTYFKSFLGAIQRKHWSKAILLDRLLADLFIKLWRIHTPDFSVLFLNAGAHIQHHYMCSSPAYKGNNVNPEWYVPKDADPLYEILALYDTILKDLLDLPNVRLMISVGMRQVPYEKSTYYWRLANHAVFLQKLGIDYANVHPRMTRDFLIEFSNSALASNAEAILKSVKTVDGVCIFGLVENRGTDLFVTLTYPDLIHKSFVIAINNAEYKNFYSDVVFVALKNGQHNTFGYFLDSEFQSAQNQDVPLKNLYGHVMSHFNLADSKLVSRQ